MCLFMVSKARDGGQIVQSVFSEAMPCPWKDRLDSLSHTFAFVSALLAPQDWRFFTISDNLFNREYALFWGISD